MKAWLRCAPLILVVSLAAGAAPVSPITEASPPTFTWSGLGGTANWSDGSNWEGGAAPPGGNDLAFPDSALQKANNNDIPAGTAFNSLSFTGPAGGYSLSGNSISLAAGISADTNAFNFLFLGVTLAGPQTFTVTGDRLAMHGLVGLASHTLTLAGQGAFVGSPTDADADDDPFPNLYQMNPDGSGREMLYDPLSLSRSHSAPAYSPGGDQIVWFCDDGAAGESFTCFNDPDDGHLVNEFLEGVNGLVVGSDPDWGFTGGALFMDLNCDGVVDGEDAAIVLSHVAGTLAPGVPCVPIGSGSSLGGAPYMIGDGDCNDSIVPFDALLVLLARAGRPKSFPACPLPGQLADISIGA